MVLDRILILFIYFGGGLAVLFSIGQFVRPGIDTRRTALALFFASVGVFQLHAALVHSRDILFVPHLLWLNVPAIYFCGPLTVAYLEAVSQNKPRFRAVHYIQLVPGIIATLAIAELYALSAEEKIAIIQEGPRNAYPALLPVVYTIGLGLVLGYALMGLRTILSLLRGEESIAQYRAPLTTLFVLFVAVCALGNAAYFLKSYFLVRVAFASVSVVFIALYFFGLRYPDLLFQAVEELRRQRSAADRMKGMDLEAVHAGLKQLMESDRVYQDEDLSLDDLAVRLQISSEQLSRFLNTQLGKNFNVFVNEYRIQAASQLLCEDPKRTVLSIAFAVGFSSSSAFHEAFRRFTGTTPGKLRRENVASSQET